MCVCPSVCPSEFNVIDSLVQGLVHAYQRTQVPRQDFYWCTGAILAATSDLWELNPDLGLVPK